MTGAESALVRGVVVVVERAGRFLMIRRSAKVIAPGAWCFVGGAIHAGETQADAVVREFREEVGGLVRPVECVWEYRRPDGGLHLYWWRAELLADGLHPSADEVAELRWVTAAEALALPGLLESNREFLGWMGGRRGAASCE